MIGPFVHADSFLPTLPCYDPSVGLERGQALFCKFMTNHQNS